jgi:hypothetical protein
MTLAVDWGKSDNGRIEVVSLVIESRKVER